MTHTTHSATACQSTPGRHNDHDHDDGNHVQYLERTVQVGFGFSKAGPPAFRFGNQTRD